MMIEEDGVKYFESLEETINVYETSEYGFFVSWSTGPYGMCRTKSAAHHSDGDVGSDRILGSSAARFLFAVQLHRFADH